jgi:hypothetical protein
MKSKEVKESMVQYRNGGCCLLQGGCSNRSSSYMYIAEIIWEFSWEAQRIEKQ